MRYLLLLLFSFQALAGPVPPYASSGFSIGGHTYATVPPIQLNCIINVNTHCTFRKAGAGAGYTPSGSNKFYVQGIRCTVNPSGLWMNLLYSTNDVGVDSATAFTGAVYANSDSSYGIIQAESALNYVGGNELDLNGNFVVPNGDYLSALTSAGPAICFAWGYEGP